MLVITLELLQGMVDLANNSFGAKEWRIGKQEEGYSIRETGNENVFGFGSKSYLYSCAHAYIKGYIAARDYKDGYFEPEQEDIDTYQRNTKAV